MKRVILSLAVLASMSVAATAQEFKMPAQSPSVTVKQDFSTSAIELSFSRPSTKGRTVFGDLIPYGKVWRMGANASTQVTFHEEVTVKGNTVKPGTYTIYAIPEAKEWTIVFNTTVGGWGTVDAKNDMFRFKVPVVSNNMTETFNMYIDNITNNSCDIVVAWEKVKVNIPVKADNDAKIVNYLENAINNPKIPYQQAAQYYLDNNKELDKALEYANKAIAGNPNAFWLHSLKAKIQMKKGDKVGAKASAKIAADAAKNTPYAAEYESFYNSIK